MSSSATELFNDFCAARVRRAPAASEQDQSHLYRCYILWAREALGWLAGGLTAEEFCDLCDATFTQTEKKGTYRDIICFATEEDVKKWDADKEGYDLTWRSTLPSLEMADKILANQNRRELVRGLIEDKRRLYADCDELEAEVEKLKAENAAFKRSQEELKKVLSLISNTLPQ